MTKHLHVITETVSFVSPQPQCSSWLCLEFPSGWWETKVAVFLEASHKVVIVTLNVCFCYSLR